MSDPDRHSEQRLHWQKETKLLWTILAFVSLQAGSAIWWAAGTNQRVNDLKAVQDRHEARFEAQASGMQQQAILSARFEQDLSGIRASLLRIDRAQEQTNQLLREYLTGRRP